MSNETSTPLETKIILTHKGDKTTIGIQQTNCDPVFFSLAGDMANAISRIPELIAEAGIRWQASSRYPKAELPDPPPAQPAATTRAASSPPARTSQNSPQTPMF